MSCRERSVGSLHAKQEWIYMNPKRVAWLGKIPKYILVEWRDETRSDIFNIGFNVITHKTNTLC